MYLRSKVNKLVRKSQSVKELSEGMKQSLKVTQLIENDFVPFVFWTKQI